MSLNEKIAQQLQPNWDDSSYGVYDDSLIAYDTDMADDKEEDEDDTGALVLLDFDGDGEADVTFSLPNVPGAPDAEEISVVDDDFDSASDDAVTVEEDNPWEWQRFGAGKFLQWLKGMIDNTPQHSGYDASGLERATAYLELLLKEITKAMRTDYKGEIDVAKCEDARDQIEFGIERLLDRLDRVKSSKHKRYNKNKKKSSWHEDSGLVKEAQKVTGVSGVVVVVPLIISRIARTLINGTVSAGHSIEDMYDKQVEEFDLTKREEAELQQLLADMGYPVPQDRGLQPGETADRRSSDNFDWGANYNS